MFKKSLQEAYHLLSHDRDGASSLDDEIDGQVAVLLCQIQDIGLLLDDSQIEMTEVQSQLADIQVTMTTIESSPVPLDETTRQGMKKLHLVIQTLGNKVVERSEGPVRMKVGGPGVNLFDSEMKVEGGLHVHLPQEQQDPAFKSLIARSSSFIKGGVCKAFVPTKPYKKAIETLSQHSQVILTGGPGDGKTTAAVHLILDKFKDLSRCLVITTPQEFNSIDLSKIDCLLFEDFCGTVQFDAMLAMDYRKILDCVKVHVQERTIAVVFSCRTPIMTQCLTFLEDQGLFNEDCVVQLASSELPTEDKVKILERHLHSKGKSVDMSLVTECINAFQSPIGLPQCSLLFSGKAELFEKGAEFFRKPYRFLCQNLDLMSKVSPAEYSFLVLMLFSEAGLKGEDLEDLEDNQVYADVLKMLNVSASQISSSYPDLYDSVADVYVKHDQTKDVYTFCHDTIKEAMFLSVGSKQKHTALVLKYCSWSIISNYVYTSEPRNKREKVLVVPQRFHKILAERFVDKILTGDLYLFQIAGHRVMRDVSFMDAFLSVVESKNAPQVILGFGDLSDRNNDHSVRQGSSSLMFYFSGSKYGNITFLEKILRCPFVQKRCTDLYRFNLGKILMLACESGSTKLYKMMIDSCAPIWPACLSVAVKKSYVEIVKHLARQIFVACDSDFANREVLDAFLVAVDQDNYELFDYLFNVVSSSESFDVSVIKSVVYQRLEVTTCNGAIINAVNRLPEDNKIQIFRDIYLLCTCKMGHIEGYMQAVKRGSTVCMGCLRETVESKCFVIAADILDRLENVPDKEWADNEKKQALLSICLGYEWSQEIWELILGRYDGIPEGCLTIAVGSRCLPLVKDILCRMSGRPNKVFQEEKNLALKEFLEESLNLRNKFMTVDQFYRYDAVFPKMYELLVKHGARFSKGSLRLAVKGQFADVVKLILNTTYHKTFSEDEKQSSLVAVCCDNCLCTLEIVGGLIESGAKVTAEVLQHTDKIKNEAVANFLFQKVVQTDWDEAFKSVCRKGNATKCKILISEGAVAKRGSLVNAVRNHPDVVKVVLENINKQRTQKVLNTTDENLLEDEFYIAMELACQQGQYFSALLLMDDDMWGLYGHTTAKSSLNLSDPELDLTSAELSFLMESLKTTRRVDRKKIESLALTKAVKSGNFEQYNKLSKSKLVKLEADMLLEAAKAECYEIVEDLLQKLKLHKKDQHCLDACLSVALRYHNSSIQQLLFKHGARVSSGCLINLVEGAFTTPDMNDVRRVLKELTPISNQNWVKSELSTCLLLSLKPQTIELTECLIEYGAQVTYGCIKGTALMAHKLPILLREVEKIKDKDWVKRDLCEALLLACEDGSENGFTSLFNFGAVVSKGCLTSALNNTKLGNKIINMILQRMCSMGDLSWITEERNEALKLTCRSGNLELYKMIKQYGGTVTKDCLSGAVSSNKMNKDIVSDILDTMDTLKLGDSFESEMIIAMETCCRKGYLEVYKWLRERNIAITPTCLNDAAQGRRVLMVEQLLKEIASLPKPDQCKFKDDLLITGSVLKSMGMQWLVQYMQEFFPDIVG